MSAILRWRPSDPGHFALRQAVRTGIVMPLALALGSAMGDEQTALFAAFGAFAMLVFVDFGGPLAMRALAYLVLATVCSGLIAVGTLCSNAPALGAAVMLVVGFAILFSGVLNGYFAAAASAALLAFVLPAMVPGDASVIGARLGGWWIAAALAVPASLFLLAARPRDRVRAGVAEACRTLAAYVRAPTEDSRARAHRGRRRHARALRGHAVPPDRADRRHRRARRDDRRARLAQGGGAPAGVDRCRARSHAR